jgi:hypothetical protein
MRSHTRWVTQLRLSVESLAWNVAPIARRCRRVCCEHVGSNGVGRLDPVQGSAVRLEACRNTQERILTLSYQKTTGASRRRSFSGLDLLTT